MVEGLSPLCCHCLHLYMVGGLSSLIVLSLLTLFCGRRFVSLLLSLRTPFWGRRIISVVLSPSAPAAKKTKYLTKFNTAWKSEFKWCQSSTKGPDYAYCTSCQTDFKVCYGGRNDLTKHTETITHQKKYSSVASTPSVTSMFNSGTNVDKVTYAETLFANYVAEHNCPFLMADHFTDLIKAMFPDSAIAQKFSCKRTKTTHIINQALAPHWDDRVSTLCRTEKFTVMIDESNDKGDNKKLNILVRVYNQTLQKVTTQFLGIPTCNIGTSQSIFNSLNQVFIDRDIPWGNCIGFSSDNCNVMVGKNNSVLTGIQEMSPSVFNVGCVCHLANICAQKAIKALPLPVDDFLVDIYYHFHHSSNRRETYKQFQDFTETDPMKILKHCSTRWLSLERCVQRTLQQWPALKSYFESHADCDKPGRVNRCKQFLVSDEMWLYFAFLEFVLPILNDFNVMFQAGESMVGFLHTEMVRLLRKLMGRFVTTKAITSEPDITKVDFSCVDNQHDDTRLAVGWPVRDYLREHDDLPPQTVNKFFSSVREFYCTAAETMIKKFPFHDKVLQGIGFLNPNTKDKISPEDVISLADRFCSLTQQGRQQLEEEATEYILTPLCDLPKFDPETTTLDQFWNSMGNMKLPSGQKQFHYLFQLSKTVLTLPHSNADTERVFSMLKKIQADSRESLADRTIHSLLSVKINNLTECHQYKPESGLVKAAKTACTSYKQSIASA